MLHWKLDDIMRVRKVKGRELAKRLGIGENYLSRMRHEGPERLSLALLEQLCRALDCTVGDLLVYEPGDAAPKPVRPVRAPQAASGPDEVQEAPRTALRGGSLALKLARLKHKRSTPAT